MANLSVILQGPENASMCEEADFCIETGCSPIELENWLQADWIQYDISAVLAGSEKVDMNPMVLVKQYDDFFVARLFSPASHLRECSEKDHEEAQVSDLNRLSFGSPEMDEGQA
jgi:hypothetical protein